MSKIFDKYLVLKKLSLSRYLLRLYYKQSNPKLLIMFVYTQRKGIFAFLSLSL